MSFDNINIGNNDFMKSFAIEVVKSYAQHSLDNESIRFNGPENHGEHGMHSQFNLINNDQGHVCKIRIDGSNPSSSLDQFNRFDPFKDM